MEEKRMEKNEEMEVMNEAELEEVNGGGILIAGGCLVGGYLLGRLIEKVTR